MIWEHVVVATYSSSLPCQRPVSSSKDFTRTMAWHDGDDEKLDETPFAIESKMNYACEKGTF